MRYRCWSNLKRNMRFLFGIAATVAFFLSICLQGHSSQRVRQWKWIGPAAGAIRQIVPDRSEPNLWYAVNNGFLYRSTNGAETWKELRLRSVDSVFVHPLTSELFVI